MPGFQIVKRKNKNQIKDLLPSRLWGIVLSYSYTYSRHMINFCNFFNLQDSIQEIQTQSKRNAEEYSKLTKALLVLENKTAKTFSLAQANIDLGLSIIKKQHQASLQEKISKHQKAMTLELNEKLKHDKTAVQELCIKIAVQEELARQLFNLKKKDEEESAQRALDAKFKKALSVGTLADERKKQIQAKKELVSTRRNLAESSFYFEEILRIIVLLEDFPKFIEEEIAQKKSWNDRIRLKKFTELSHFSKPKAKTIYRIGEAFLVSLCLALFISVIIWVFTFPLVVLGWCIVNLILGHGTLSTLVPWLIPSFAAIGMGAMALIKEFFFHYDDGEGNLRFEAHYLSSSFSEELNAQFDEIKEKIGQFQCMKEMIGEETEMEEDKRLSQPHPMMALNKNSARVGKIREAIKTELTFFKSLYKPLHEEDLSLLREEGLFNPSF